MIKILYLAPLVPSRSGNGGRRAVYNHILELASDNTEIDAVFVDVEESLESFPSLPGKVNSKIVSRGLPKFNSNYRAKLSALIEHFLNSLPRALRVIAAESSKKYVKNALDSHKYDAVIIDHFNAYGLIHGLDINCPLIYIAHNIEAAILEDQISQIPVWRPSRWLRRMDIVKLQAMELELCQKAKCIVPISSTDAMIEPISAFSRKVTVWPELPTEKGTLWQPNNHKTILFVGSSRYFPNRDAIEWLAGNLIPALRQSDPNIVLNIAGTASDEIESKYHTEGVNYLGFVSDEELERLHLESTLFISPVVLGGGIKIKVLEASSYGIPIAATCESLNGIEYLSSHAIRFSRNSKSDIERIGNLLTDSDELARLSKVASNALKAARQKRVRLKEIILNAGY